MKPDNPFYSVVAGQQNAPPASNAPPAQKPTAEKPAPQTQPGYKPTVPVTDDMSTGDKLWAAVHNAPHSLMDAGMGVAGAVLHPIDTAKGIWSFGQGLVALVDQYNGNKLTPEQEKALEPVKAFGNELLDKYNGDPSHMLSAFANNPASVLMDVASVASAGELSLLKIPGLARIPGAVTAGRTLGAVARVTDPFTAPVTAAKGVLGAMGVVNREAIPAERFLSRNGRLTQEADDAIRAASNGAVTAADISDPAAAAAIFAREGKISPESARTVIMQSAHPDVAPSLPIVEGKLKDPTMYNQLQRVMENNEKLFSRGVEDVAGGSAPEHAMLGRALDDAATQSHNAVQARYDQVAAMGHSLAPGALSIHFPSNTVLPAIRTKLEQGNFLTAGARDPYMAMRTGAYPRTAEAIDIISRGMRTGATAAGNVPLRVTERVRGQLNDLFHTATGSDRAGLRAVIDGFDETVTNAVNDPNMLLNRAGARANPADGPGLVQIMTDARAANKAHMDTFAPTSRTTTQQGVQIGNHTGQLFKAQTPTGSRLRTPSADDTIYAATGAGMNKNLLDTNKGAALYDKLKTALQAGDPAGAAARVRDLNTNIRQSLAKLSPQDFAEHMKPNKLASKVFTNEELSKLRLINTSRGYQTAFNKKPIPPVKKPSLFSALNEPLQRRIVGGLLGHIAAPGIGGLITGAAAEGLVEHTLVKRHDYNKLSRVLREKGATPPLGQGWLARGLKGAVGAPLNYRRPLLQANKVGNAMGAYGAPAQAAGTQAGGDVAPILATIKARESAGEKNPYTAVNRSGKSSASGAYQFTDRTWYDKTHQYGIGTQYARAAHAPPAVQDKVAELYTRELLQQAHGDVSKIPLAWFTGNMAGQFGPGGAEANPGMSPSRYQQLWLAEYAKHAKGTRTAATGGRIERAAGGGVKGKTHEQLVRRLMGMADTARREVNKSTKPLLDMHDNAVAHALAVANRAI
jgi:hypothetical protein